MNWPEVRSRIESGQHARTESKLGMGEPGLINVAEGGCVRVRFRTGSGEDMQ